MKRILCLLLTASFLFCLSGCSSAFTTDSDLSKELRNELMMAIMMEVTRKNPEKPGEGQKLFADSNTYYLGTYQKYIAVFCKSYQFAIWDETIGEERFCDSTYSGIYLVRGTEYIELRNAYREGKISDKNLFRLAASYYRFKGLEIERYAGVEPSENEILSEENRKDIAYQVLYAYAKQIYEMDINAPGKGAQIFADCPYYYMGTYQNGHAVFYDQDYQKELVLYPVGEEFFSGLHEWFNIYLYQGDTKKELSEVYEENLLTDEELFALAKRFYQFRLEHAEDPDAVRQLYGDYAARYESP